MLSAVSTAAVIAAGVSLAVMLVMMVAADIGIEVQMSGNESGNCLICTAGHTTVQIDICCCQRIRQMFVPRTEQQSGGKQTIYIGFGQELKIVVIVKVRKHTSITEQRV